MAAYVIVDVHLADPAVQAICGAVPRTLEVYGGRFLARGGGHETIEGDCRLERIVMLEFPDLQAAKAWYALPGHQAISPTRLQSSRAGFFITFVGVMRARYGGDRLLRLSVDRRYPMT